MTEWIEAKNRVCKTFLGIYDVRMCFELINICFLRYLEGEGGGGVWQKARVVPKLSRLSLTLGVERGKTFLTSSGTGWKVELP